MCDTTSERYRVSEKYLPPNRVDFDEYDIPIFEEFLRKLYINEYSFQEYSLRFIVRDCKFEVVKTLNKDREILYVEISAPTQYDPAKPMFNIDRFLEHLEEIIRYIQKSEHMKKPVTCGLSGY